MAEIAKHPNLKIVSSVNGNWDQTTAQKAVATVLPSLLRRLPNWSSIRITGC